MFVECRQGSGKSKEFLTAANTSINAGDCLTFSGGYVTPVTASITATTPLMVAKETVVTEAGEHKKINCILVDPTIEFTVDTATQATDAQVGTSVKFSDAGTVANATTGGPARILEVLANKKAVVKFY